MVKKNPPSPPNPVETPGPSFTESGLSNTEEPPVEESEASVASEDGQESLAGPKPKHKPSLEQRIEQLEADRDVMQQDIGNIWNWVSAPQLIASHTGATILALVCFLILVAVIYIFVKSEGGLPAIINAVNQLKN